MPSYARRDLIPPQADCLVHTVSRCVRRAWLCGSDPLSGRRLSHRRRWLEVRLRHLASFFAVEVFAYAVMANHYHLVLRCRPSVAAGWSPEEVACRWLSVCGQRGGQDWEDKVRAMAGDAGRVAACRERLGSVSWFMRLANEWLARRANAEDRCTGRFWEGRFRCQLLEDDAALLACMAYVDLNPVRAGAAARLEDCRFTSIRERMSGLGAGAGGREAGAGAAAGSPGVGAAPPGRWLAPMAEEGEEAGGAVGLTTAEYVRLLRWTGRRRGAGGMERARAGRRPPALDALGVQAESWDRLVGGFGRMFRRVAGRPEAMEARARALGLRWLAGVRPSRELFPRQAA